MNIDQESTILADFQDEGYVAREHGLDELGADALALVPGQDLDAL